MLPVWWTDIIKKILPGLEALSWINCKRVPGFVAFLILCVE